MGQNLKSRCDDVSIFDVFHAESIIFRIPKTNAESQWQRYRPKYIWSGKNTIVYRNAFVTNHTLDIENVTEVVEVGRGRWKTENENHNVLKTKGYNLEHNFGSGEKHLSST